MGFAEHFAAGGGKHCLTLALTRGKIRDSTPHPPRARNCPGGEEEEGMRRGVAGPRSPISAAGCADPRTAIQEHQGLPGDHQAQARGSHGTAPEGPTNTQDSKDAHLHGMLSSRSSAFRQGRSWADLQPVVEDGARMMSEGGETEGQRGWREEGQWDDSTSLVGKMCDVERLHVEC